MIALDPLADAQPEITPGFHEYGIDDLLNFNPGQDPDCLLGDRWLSRGMSCLWIGPAGIGKSSLRMQLAIAWGLGDPTFGIKPVRPLRSLIVQAENVEGDEAEMLQGVIAGMGLSERIPEIREQVSVLHCSTLTGSSFVSSLEKEIQKRRPDLVWVDPLLSYVGDDIALQKVASDFLRHHLQPMIDRTKICLHMMHHTGKPPKDSARRSGNEYDFVYQSFGSSELANWPRAINIIFPEAGDTFLLKLQKRGKRAGALGLEGEATTSVFIQHGSSGICWQQCDEPVGERKANEPKVKLARFAEILKAHGGRCTNANVAEVANKLNVSERTCWNYWNELKALREVDHA